MPSIILDVYIVASVFNLNFLLHKLLVIFTDKPKEGKKKPNTYHYIRHMKLI